MATSRNDAGYDLLKLDIPEDEPRLETCSLVRLERATGDSYGFVHDQSSYVPMYSNLAKLCPGICKHTQHF